ncbi:MAG: Holliday junction resolvase Hjc [Candidatus Woesearchaeota archaeon]
MSKKSRGTNAERDLIHKFWGIGWAAMRAAGSGSSQFPSPDVICGNNLRKIAMEVKLTTESRKYFSFSEIRDLKYFCEKFGAEPWVGIKFFRKEWVFLMIDDLESSGKNFVVSQELASIRGLTFEELTRL